TAESDQLADCRLPRLQRRHRSDARERPRRRRRRTGGPRGRGGRCIRGPGCPRARVERAGRPGGVELAPRKISWISGGHLRAGRAYAQAVKFGAQVVVAKGATRLACDGQRYVVEVDAATRIAARAVIIATGAQYRKPNLENLSTFEGAGVYYGATRMEAQLCVGEEVVVVGGGNSAGQAAVFLSATARRVHLLVRGAGLADTMSR